MRHIFKTISVTLLLLLGACNDNAKKAHVFLAQGDFLRAETFFTQAIEKNPNNFEARLGLGKALLQKAYYQAEVGEDTPGHWERALRELRIAENVQPGLEAGGLAGRAAFRWTKSLCAIGDTAKALNMLKTVLELNPSNLEARNFVGILYHKRGLEDQAHGIFLRNTKIDSTDPAAFYNLGMLHWRRQEFLQAYQWWVKAFTLSPENEDIVYWMVQAEKKAIGDERQIHP